MYIDDLITLLTNIKEEKGNLRVNISKKEHPAYQSTMITNVKETIIYPLDPYDRENIVVIETY